MSMNLSLVIVSWNTAELLNQCLTSIFASPPEGSFEVIVVDNASTDTSVQMVRERFSQVKVIDNQENLGFAGGNNQAIRQSQGRYVLLLNPDTAVKPEAFNHLIDFMDKNPNAGAVGPLTLNPDGTLQTSCYPVPTLFREFWRLCHLDAIYAYGIYCMENWDKSKVRKVDALLGACLLLRKTALDQVGLLDETYFIYSEEIDLCYRLQKAGWQLYWIPQARIVHYGGQSTQQVVLEMFMQLYQGKLIFIRKHYGWFAGKIYKLILLIVALLRLLVSPLAWLERPKKRRRHLKLASQYWKLIRVLPNL